MEQAKRIVYTLLRVFFGAVIAFVLANQLNVFDVSWTNYQAAAIAGASAVLVAIFNALNPGDTRYGVGYEPEA
jgi:hypothetical protein